jgi:hypothetical protein
MKDTMTATELIKLPVDLCTSRVITTIMIELDTRYTNDERQLLRLLIPQLVDMRVSSARDRMQVLAWINASIRVIAPMGLDAVKWHDLAAQLRVLAPIVDTTSVQAAEKALALVKDKAQAYAALRASGNACTIYSAHYAALCALWVTYGAYRAAGLATEDDDVHNDAAAGAATIACYRAADAAYADDTTDADNPATDAAGRRSTVRRPTVLATIAALEGVIAIGKSW